MKKKKLHISYVVVVIVMMLVTTQRASETHAAPRPHDYIVCVYIIRMLDDCESKLVVGASECESCLIQLKMKIKTKIKKNGIYIRCVATFFFLARW